MTVETTTIRVVYTGDGSSISFTTPCPFYANTDWLVIVNGTTQTLNTAYNVTGADTGSNGTVTFTTAPAAGVTVQLILNVPLTQESEYVDDNAFPSATVEEDFDRAAQGSLRLYDLIQRCLRAPDGDSAPIMLLPPASQRTGVNGSGTYLTFDGILGNAGLATSLPSGTLSGASIGAFLYPQTQAEISAGVQPLVLTYPFGNALRYGADPTYVNDSTAALTNMLLAVGVGGSAYVPLGKYKLTGPLSLQNGQTLRGDGWATVTNSLQLAAGTVIVQQLNTLAPTLEINGGGGSFASPGNNQSIQFENVQIRDIAFIAATSPGGTGIGLWANMARKIAMRNVYMASFSNPVQWVNTSWLCQMEHCTFIDFTGTGMLLENSTDDNVFIGNQYSGYYPQSIGVAVNSEGANNTFIGCYFQGCSFGVQLNQYDDGAGHLYPMGARFIGCLMEDIVCAGFALNSTLTNPTLPTGFAGNKGHPALMIDGLRAYNSGNFTQTTYVTGGSTSGTIATLNFAAVPAAYVIPVGSQVNITGVTPSGCNVTNATVLSSSTTSITYANTTAAGAVSSGGQIFSGAIPNHGQTIVYAQFASQISVKDVSYANGFSYATVLLGPTTPNYTTGQYGYFYNPTGAAPVGPVVWEQDNNAIWGGNGGNNSTARFAGATASITLIPGDRAYTELSSTGLSYSSGTVRLPFVTVVNDFPQWASSANNGWIPLRNQTVRFKAQIYVANAPLGAYSLLLFKNGSQLAILCSLTVSTTSNPLTLAGDFYDTPNGSTDIYDIRVSASVAFTLSTSPGSTFAIAELAGR